MKENEILEGPILKTIIKIALPIATISLMGFLYNIINMIFVSHEGPKSIAAIAIAAVIVQFWFALLTLVRIGAQAKVAQAIGSGDKLLVRNLAAASFQLGIIISAVIFLSTFIFATPLATLGGATDPSIIEHVSNYLRILSIGSFAMIGSSVLTAQINATGETKMTMYFYTLGLVVNILLDVVLIGFLKMGVEGAAVATVISQFITMAATYIYWNNRNSIFHNLQLFKIPEAQVYKEIIGIGLPVAINRVLFAVFSLLIARALTQYGDTVVGVQRVGIQVEAITWMVSFGIGEALATFIGQNFGANNMKRVVEGYKQTMWLMFRYGVIVSVIMFIFADPIMRIFLSPSSQEFSIGVTYLRIIAVSEMFMVLEIVTNGAFEGIGKTLPPSIISTVFTGLRVPFAYLSVATIGLSGVWWSISGSSIIKGILAVIVFIYMLNKLTNLSLYEDLDIETQTLENVTA